MQAGVKCSYKPLQKARPLYLYQSPHHMPRQTAAIEKRARVLNVLQAIYRPLDARYSRYHACLRNDSPRSPVRLPRRDAYRSGRTG
ncbi:hypothetical protein VTK26DRAFT_6730 [Humicola hyalothermophila]